MKKIIAATVAVLVLVIVALFIVSKKDSVKNDQFSIPQNTAPESGWRVVDRDSYSFQAPQNWIENGPRDFEGCQWDGISNDTSDGARLAGEIGIYQKSCFDLSKALGRREVTEKSGYYIIAYYNKESGTSPEEETETKSVYEKIVSSFIVK